MTKNWQKNFDLLSKIAFVLLGFAIPLSVTAVAVLVVIIVASILLSGNLLNKYQFLFNNYLAIFALILFALYLMGAIYSTAPLHSIFNGLHKYRKLLLIPLFLPICQQQKWRTACINAFLLAIVITLFFSLIEWAKDLHSGGGNFFGAVFRSHIETGLMVAFASFILAHKIIANPRSKYRIIYAITLIVSAFYLFFMNISRTGYLTAIFLAILLILQKFGKKGLLLIIITIPLFLSSLFIFSDTFHNRIKGASQEVLEFVNKTVMFSSIGDRLGFVDNSMTLIKKSPILGTGTGSFENEYKKIAVIPPEFADKGLTNPHNEYLMTAVQLGMIGLFFFLLILGAEWKMSFALPFLEQYFAQGLVIAFMIASFCDTMLYLSTPGYFFLYFSAVLFSTTTKFKTE